MQRKNWTRFLLLPVVIVLYSFAIFFSQTAKKNADLTYIILAQNIDSTTAEEIFAQEKTLTDSVGFCFWGEAETQTVTCEETGGIARVSKVILSGNPGLMGAGILAWQDGCFIDKGTAQKLFGTDTCGGQTLWQNDIPFRVFGTIETFEPTMLTIAGHTDGSILNRCVLSVPAESGKQIASAFMIRWGLQGNLVDFYPLWTMCHNLLLLAPAILLIAAFIWGVRKIRTIHGENGFSASQIPILIKPALFLLSVICLFLFLASQFIVLQDMIPSRWSDFSFWGNWLETQEENFRHVMLTPMGNAHLQMMLNMLKSLICTIASVLLALKMIRRQNHANTSDRG